VRSGKDVDELKTQVEALRKQLVELEQKNAEQAAAKAAAERAAAEEHAAAEAALKEANEAKASVAKVKLELASVNDPSPEKSAAAPASGAAGGGEALLMPAAAPASAEKKAPGGWTVPMALPTQARERGAKDVATESLPKPELDFSRLPSMATAEEIAARGSLKGASPWREKIRMVGLIVVLGAVGLGSYEKVAPYLSSFAKKTVNSSGAAKSAGPKPVPAKPAAAATVAATTTGSAEGNSAVPAKPNSAETGAAVPGKDSGPGNNAPPSSEVKESGPEPKQPEEAAKKEPAKERAATKKSRASERSTEASPAELVAADAPVIPAKLLHAATPVYPPDAMRKYITGDVKAELVVGASGKVGEVKVVSGPNALREAAVEALKRYEYEPATQGGKAVTSKTTAVVKFWFNP
jgi:protein TonB